MHSFFKIHLFFARLHNLYMNNEKNKFLMVLLSIYIIYTIKILPNKGVIRYTISDLFDVCVANMNKHTIDTSYIIYYIILYIFFGVIIK